ncbi:MAG: CapA family protein [Treponema sp.]|nr:CapA family protein [Treponema sp.]
MKKQNCVKITFTGDIMCTRQEIPAHKTKTGDYDFSEIFYDCKNYFADSDYVVGNLETPIANADYCSRLINYNSPIAFAQAVKKSGISMVTTANNHCLDRGVRGLEDTIKNLDAAGLKQTGLNSQNKLPTGLIEDIGNIKTGFLSYTYGTNAGFNKNYLEENEKWKVNLFQEQEHHKLKKKPFYSFDKMYKDIKALKNKGAEYLIMCLHAGGQYNPFPSKDTKKITELIANMGVDAVITNHEHVIHNVEFLSDKIIAYSLGNFTSLFCIYSMPFLRLSDYSVILNIYLSKENQAVKPADFTFSIAKSIAAGKNRVKTVLLYDLIKSCTNKRNQIKLLQDNLKIYNRLLNHRKAEIELKLEYSLKP